LHLLGRPNRQLERSWRSNPKQWTSTLARQIVLEEMLALFTQFQVWHGFFSDENFDL
jgi:hypothetical protein